MPNQHSPEPWKRTPSEGLVAMLDDLSGPPRTVSIYCDSWGDKVHHIALQVSSEDADRILACVNACKNVSTDTLERMLQGDCCIVLGKRKEAVEVVRKALDGTLDLNIVPFDSSSTRTTA